MTKESNNNRMQGFTIVELLVVIVVIGVLAAITAVSYTGITQRADTSAGQSFASNVLAKAAVYASDGPTGNWPTTFASLTTAASTTPYFMPAASQDFTRVSNGVVAAPGRTMTTATRAYSGLTYSNESVDYVLCGTTGAAGTPGSYAAINVPTGIKIGYWNYASSTLNITDNVAGVTTGDYPVGSGYNVACFHVGLGEAVAAVAKSIAANTTGGYYPYTGVVAAFTAGTTAAKLPTGVSVSVTADPTSGTGLTSVRYKCLTTCNSTMTGAQITYWDFSTGALSTAANAIYLGTATSGGTFVNPAS